MSQVVKPLQRYFRKRRNVHLNQLIAKTSKAIGRDLNILDVGGRAEFWQTVSPSKIAKVTIANISASDINVQSGRFELEGIYATVLDLEPLKENGFDLVVCNSVIEHLGTWKNIKEAAVQLVAVAPVGFVQTPSFWFPVEQHFMIPFFHWFPYQMRAAALPYLPRRGYQDANSIDKCRAYVEDINLLTNREFSFLFPNATIIRERVLLITKSYIAIWSENGH